MNPDSPWEYILCMPELQNIDIGQHSCQFCGIVGACHCQQISPDTTMPAPVQYSLNLANTTGVDLPDVSEKLCYSVGPIPEDNPFSPGQINVSSSTSGMRVNDPSMGSQASDDLFGIPMHDANFWTQNFAEHFSFCDGGTDINSTQSPRTQVMQQHRENERSRHRGLNITIKEISKKIPGYCDESRKDTKIVKLQRIIQYICFMEKNISSLCEQLNLRMDFSDVFLITHLRKRHEHSSGAQSSTTDSAILSGCMTSLQKESEAAVEALQQAESQHMKLSSPTIDSTTDFGLHIPRLLGTDSQQQEDDGDALLALDKSMQDVLHNMFQNDETGGMDWLDAANEILCNSEVSEFNKDCDGTLAAMNTDEDDKIPLPLFLLDDDDDDNQTTCITSKTSGKVTNMEDEYTSTEPSRKNTKKKKVPTATLR